MELKKIVIIGPESTGKSTLCQQLAQHFNTGWIPEYAREYLEENGTSYSYDDLLTIANGQIGLEEERVSGFGCQVSGVSDQVSGVRYQVSGKAGIDSIQLKDFVFIDTDMYVMKVWCEYVFNDCHSQILNIIASRQYDAYLLCNIDLPWTQDNLREYPDLKEREKLFHYYKDILVNQSTPWKIISGENEQRLEMAVQFINELF